MLAGASGTHVVCVCTIHQNVKLMMVGGKVADLTADDDVPLRSLTVSHKLLATHLNQLATSLMPNFMDRLKIVMDKNLIDTVVYKQWVSVDRSTLETFSKSADDFVDNFCEKLEVLLPRSFITRHQSSFQTQLKEELLPGEFLVVADFSENYSFVLQDEAQSFHWNNTQATLHLLLPIIVALESCAMS